MWMSWMADLCPVSISLSISRLHCIVQLKSASLTSLEEHTCAHCDGLLQGASLGLQLIPLSVYADITIGPLVVDALRPLTDAPLDTHL